jgi:hypothetical protein
MYADWRLIPIPARLANRPRDIRGYPIPAVVLMRDDGTPDFRVTDARKWVAAYERKTCSLCGVPLGRHLAFIGGPLTFENRYFSDLPAHLECAQYAMAVCPYIAVPNFKYAESIVVDADIKVKFMPEVSDTRPARFFLGITKSCKAERTGDGSLLVRAGPWEQASWWVNGECVEPLHRTSSGR